MGFLVTETDGVPVSDRWGIGQRTTRRRATGGSALSDSGLVTRGTLLTARPTINRITAPVPHPDA
ncbi:hypothetical protein GCM10012289_05790 [Nonomuraea cavernae]|uniref:Uncharacterized protein n=1 Tax=Nonomuraea cavernae TaxID=2045107 RepID=A0A917YNV2_9ACTN|nr:hypothetical protein GCM10012289_05790 [Nonomuraea cavernae]